MTPKEQEFLDEYKEMIDENFEFKIADMVYSAADAFEAVDPMAFKRGLQEFIDMEEEDAEYEEYLSSPAGIAETKERRAKIESRKGSETDDEEPDIKFKFPPRKFQFKPEWQKVNKSWKGILKTGEI